MQATYSRDESLFLARISSQADLHEETIQFMKQAIQYDEQLNRYELTLLFDTYRYIASSKITSLRVLDQRKEKEEHRGDRFTRNIKELVNKVKEELDQCCKDVIELIDNNLLKTCKDDETILMILTKKGDFLKRMAEWEDPVKKLKLCQQAINAYQEATAIGVAKLKPNSYDRITLAQNVSSLYYYELEEREFGFNLAKEALEKAMIAEEEEDDQRYLSHSTPLDLLRDQVCLWMEELGKA